MSQTCNHVAAALYRMEAAVRSGLTNPACTSKPNEWLPSKKIFADIPAKIKDLDIEREDFATRGKRKRPFTTKFKKSYDPLHLCTTQPLQLTSIAQALEKIAPKSIVHTAIAKPEVDFFIEKSMNDASANEKSIDTISIDDIVVMFSCITEFYNNMKQNMTKENVHKIENVTRGQSCYKHWFSLRNGVITASKGHDVMTKMKKVQKLTGGYINMYALNEKVSGRTFINPDIPALKYGREIEPEAANVFKEYFMESHKNIKISNCGLFLDHTYPFIGASRDGIISCSCCAWK